MVVFTNTGDGGLDIRSEANDFDFLVLVDDTAFRLQIHQHMRHHKDGIQLTRPVQTVPRPAIEKTSGG